jgi:hypothetical protein
MMAWYHAGTSRCHNQLLLLLWRPALQAHAASKRHATEAEGRGALRLLYDAAANPRVWLVGLAALLKNAAMVGILFW